MPTLKTFLGGSDKGCFDAGELSENEKDKYLVDCPNEDDVCLSESVVDWFPKGDHVYAISKTCGPKPNENESVCVSYTGAVNFKDCTVWCQNDDCNRNNDALWEETTSR